MNANGAARRQRAQGVKADGLNSALGALEPQLAEWADGFIFDEVWGREGISHDERMLVAITALASNKNGGQLRNYLHGAVQAGIPPQKIHEALVMLNVYCGFPVAIQALSVWKEVIDVERRRGTTIELRDNACA